MLARLHLSNQTLREQTLILEPWANEFCLLPGQEYIIEGDGPAHPSPFEIEDKGAVTVVWAWSGADARLLTADGTVLADWTGLRMPPIPGSSPPTPGWTPRALTSSDFNHWLSGGQLDGVELILNQSVELLAHGNRGQVGSVISPESLDGSLNYRVELSSGRDVVVRASDLAAYFEWSVAV